MLKIHNEETRSTHQTSERYLKVEEEDQTPVPITAWDTSVVTAEPSTVAQDESIVVSEPTISDSDDSASLTQELMTPASQPVIPMEALEEVEMAKAERKALYERIEDLSSIREAGLLARIATLEAELQNEREESAALRERVASLEKEDVLMDFGFLTDLDLTCESCFYYGCNIKLVLLPQIVVWRVFEMR